MNEIFIPYLLILLGWNDLDPDKTMTVSHELFISEEMCRQAGTEWMENIDADRAARLEKFNAEQIKTEASKFFCIPQRDDIQKHRPLLDDN
ncbi:MAG: hypothetical protein V7676_02425 [Parasphingorhabdus sp.]|uniref:hypothetical protein n=1 Tax=Parasphingorhabdus sp. TaxID=2709688 RepID=UPI0030029805